MATIDVVLAGMGAGSDQTRLGISTVALIRGKHNILVDVGHYGRREHLEQGLRSRGLTPDDIPLVVLTHAHWDHVQNVDLFPRATFVLHPKELAYSRAPRKGDWATPNYFAATLQGGKIREVVEGDELESGVTVLETPGHAPGHISLLVNTPEGVAVVAADAFPDAGTVRRGRPYLIFWSEREAEESVRKIRRHSNVIYPGHNPPFRIEGDGSVRPLGDIPSLNVRVGYEPAGINAAASVTVEGARAAWSHPEAKG